uniref:Maspardin n=1 Tax=Ciona savignyi TaxID=51511 RepID=H2YFZ7_CIOSA
VNILIKSKEYQAFQSSVPLKQIVLEDNGPKKWKYYDTGTRSDSTCPIICLPPACGTANMFYQQVVSLSSFGHRVIAIDYPIYWSVEEFCVGLKKFINTLRLNKVHLFGCSLGGFLAMKFAEQIGNKSYVASLFLCNPYTDTSLLKSPFSPFAFFALPSLILKKFILGDLPLKYVTINQANSLEFVADALESVTQREIASRLTLQYQSNYVNQPQRLQTIPTTVMDAFDDTTFPQTIKDNVYKCLPLGKRAHLKTGGYFPYLSESLQVNLHLRV